MHEKADRRPVGSIGVRTAVGFASLVVFVLAVLTGGDALADPAAASGAVGPVAVSPTTGRVLVGTEEGLWWSDDQGAHWRAAHGLGTDRGVDALAFSVSQPNVVYAGVFWIGNTVGSGVRVSRDGGATWHSTGRWPQLVNGQPAALDELAVDPSNPSIVYATTHGVLRQTRDGGMTWNVAPTGRPTSRFFLGQQFVTDAQGALYFATGRATGAGQIVRSSDHGESWRSAGSGLPSTLDRRLLRLASDSGTPAHVYEAGRRGVYATSNAGRTWAPILRTPAYAIDATTDDGAPVVVVASDTGSAASTRLLERRGTGRWTQLNTPVDGSGYVTQLRFALDPTNSNQLYAWSYDQNDAKNRSCATLFSSSDNGVTWTSTGRGLPLVRRNCRPS